VVLFGLLGLAGRPTEMEGKPIAPRSHWKPPACFGRGRFCPPVLAAVFLLAIFAGGEAGRAAAAARSTSATLRRKVALRVNGIAVDAWSFEKGFEEYLRTAESPSTPSEARRAYREALIRQLLVESYAKRKKLDRDPEFLRRLEAARRRLLFEFVLEREVLSHIKITTDSVVRYYESHGDEFTEPAKIIVRHILARTRAEAERARKRILAGEDFAKVAAEMSIHPSKSKGGLLPPFSRGTYQPEFERAAFALKVGELSDVVRTDLGWHVIEKTAEEPARVKPLSEVAPKIRRILYERERKRLTAEFLAKLARRARIETPLPKE